jgi:SAM-dependent methyltransferase
MGYRIVEQSSIRLACAGPVLGMPHILVGFVVLLVGLSAYVILRNTQPVMATSVVVAAVGSAVSRMSVGLLVARSGALAAPLQIERLVQQLSLDGREQILDLHAGSPMVHDAVARKLTTGCVARLSLIRFDAASHCDPVNPFPTPEGDLPFRDASFDLVISRLAVHHVTQQTRRARLLRETARGLKPGGKVVLVDCCHTNQYMNVLLAAGLCHVERRPESLLTLPRLDRVTATKHI